MFALAEEMRKEYELIVSKRLVLQLDCPDLAMERHISYQDEPLEAFKRWWSFTSKPSIGLW